MTAIWGETKNAQDNSQSPGSEFSDHYASACFLGETQQDRERVPGSCRSEIQIAHGVDAFCGLVECGIRKNRPHSQVADIPHLSRPGSSAGNQPGESIAAG